MIFDYRAFCRLGDVFEHEGADEVRCGAEDTLCIVLVSSGQCSVLRHTALLARAGSFVLSYQPLALACTSGCHMVGAVLQGSAAQSMGARLDAPLVLDGAAAPGAAEIIYRLHADAHTLSCAQASAFAYTLLCLLAEAEAEAPQRRLPPLVALAIEQMHQHYAEVYGVEELAAQLGVSKSHLVRSFSAAVGLSPGQYLSAVRVDAAKRLLLHREYTLEIVANLCGFSGANYLCKVFKKATGYTPAAWRRAGSQRQRPHATDAWEEQWFL